MLEEILGSKTKIKVLRKFAENPKREYTLEELSSATGLSHGGLYPAIRQLVEVRAIITKKIGRSTSYILNMPNLLIKEILKLFLAEARLHINLARRFVRTLNPRQFKEINKVIMFGSVARGTAKLGSDIDMLFILNRPDRTIENKVQTVTQKFLEKNDVIISPLFITEREFSSDIDFIIRVKRDGEILYERRTKK